MDGTSNNTYQNTIHNSDQKVSTIDDNDQEVCNIDLIVESKSVLETPSLTTEPEEDRRSYWKS